MDTVTRRTRDDNRSVGKFRFVTVVTGKKWDSDRGTMFIHVEPFKI